MGRIQIGLKDDSVSEPVGGIAGASNAFVVKASNFVITDITRLDLVANPAASTPTGDIFVAAGADFRVVVEVRDSEGALTPNYGNESSAEGLLLSAATLVAPGSRSRPGALRTAPMQRPRARSHRAPPTLPPSAMPGVALGS